MAELYLLDCPTYADYLNTFIKPDDVRYLRSQRYCRYLVSLGYRSTMDIYTEPIFEKRKAAVLALLQVESKRSKVLSEGIEITDPFLRELADREVSNMQGIMATIIFINHRRKSGFEISGYIDFEEGLRAVENKARGARDWRSIFAGTTKLKPRTSDLSFVDWKNSRNIFYNNSENFIVNNDVNGLKFMFRGDHKMIDVNADTKTKRIGTRRTMVYSPIYGYVIIYDYMVNQSHLDLTD